MPTSEQFFFFAAQLAPMFNPIAASSLMGLDMQNFVYINLAMCAIGLVCIPIMKYSFRRIKNSGKLAVDNVKNVDNVDNVKNEIATEFKEL